jgi:hypothetical protein
MKQNYITTIELENNILYSNKEIEEMRKKLQEGLQLYIELHPMKKGSIATIGFTFPKCWKVKNMETIK